MNQRKEKVSESFDSHTKTFYRRKLTEWQLHVTSEFEVFARTRKIDWVVQCEDDDLVRLQPTVLQHFRRLNTLELKGIHDPLTLRDLYRIKMRAWALLSLFPLNPQPKGKRRKAKPNLASRIEGELLPDQCSITILAVVRPDRLLDTLADRLKVIRTERTGVYRCDVELTTWIIHPDELEVIPENYLLLPLARGKKLAEFIEICLRDGLTDYLELILDVGLLNDPNAIWQKLWEVNQMRPKIKEETWPYIDRFFQEVPEAIENLPTIRNTLQEAVQAAAQAATQAATQAAAQAAAQASTEGEQRGWHHTLLLVLQHKFGTLPVEMARQVEQITELAQLDRCLNQALIAKSLDELSWLTPINR